MKNSYLLTDVGTWLSHFRQRSAISYKCLTSSVYSNLTEMKSCLETAAVSVPG